MSGAKKRIALVGARGHTGAELIRLLDDHPGLELTIASSRQAVGTPLGSLVPGVRSALTVVDLAPQELAQADVDAVVLALPNGTSTPWVDALSARNDVVIVDLSADHRFDAAWAYGLPELHRSALLGSKRIANPGCYATGAQLALAPLLDAIDGVPVVFGVSGYSGAGTTPSPRNDPAHLRDNVIPYALTDHTHEREISRHLARRVAFLPHVAPFFRGIILTISAALVKPLSAEDVLQRWRARYANDPLVHVSTEIPLVRDAVGTHHVTLGGPSVLPDRIAVTATLDNLLKGAATQAVQNLNLALGLPELAGIPAPSGQD